MRYLLFAAFLSTGLLVAPLSAEVGKGPNPEEIKKRLLEKFDANGDGRLSEQEQMQAQEVLRRQGVNVPVLPPGGFPGAAEFLKRFDANGDGQLNDQERFAAQAAYQKMRGQGGNGAGGVAGGIPFNGGVQGGESGNAAGDLAGNSAEGKPAPDKRSALVKRFDKDGDGKLNDEEKATAQAELKNAKGAKAKAKARAKADK